MIARKRTKIRRWNSETSVMPSARLIKALLMGSRPKLGATIKHLGGLPVSTTTAFRKGLLVLDGFQLEDISLSAQPWFTVTPNGSQYSSSVMRTRRHGEPNNSVLEDPTLEMELCLDDCQDVDLIFPTIKEPHKAQVINGSQFKMIHVMEMMQDNDSQKLKSNHKAQDQGSKA
ncbi:hypothetical protein Tco_0579622 [Tanacetum coccineum]